MHPWLVGDRFIYLGRAGWRDLVTGARVRVDLRPMTRDLTRRDGAPDERGTSSPARGDADVLIDRGRAGVSGWFEARGSAHLVRPAAARLPSAAVTEILRVARARDVVGMRTCRTPSSRSRSRALSLALSMPLRRLGFVVVRADRRLGPGIQFALAHRHLAIVVSTEQEEGRAAQWIERLARESDRGHLVVDTRRPAPNTDFGAGAGRQRRRVGGAGET